MGKHRWWGALRRLGRVLGAVALLGVVFGAYAGLTPRPPSPSAGAGCVVDEPVLPVPFFVPPDAPGGTLLGEAGHLARAGRLDAAEDIYTDLLKAQEPQALAAHGVAYVQWRRASAEEAVSSAGVLAARGNSVAARRCYLAAARLDRDNESARQALRVGDSTLPMSAKGSWDGFYERWLGPAIDALLPVLAALAVLLVLARLLTPLAVPPGALAWPDWARRTVWWAGLALLALAALRTTMLMGWDTPDLASPPDRSSGAAVVVVGLAAAATVVVLSRRGWREPDGPGGNLPWKGYVPRAPIAAIVVVFALLPLAIWSSNRDVWPWAGTAVVAVLGLALVAAGRGHALRLQVRVTKAGQDDAAASAFALARLQELGDAPPQGLKSPQLVDVTDLPADALSALPAGRLAAPLTRLLRLLSPSVPWRATVEDDGGKQLTVTVTRNGSVARSLIVSGERFRNQTPLPGGGDTPSAALDREDLITAASAVVLTELGERHRQLKVGLCGATSWQSVAAHVVATRWPEPVARPELKKELLAFAVRRDPDNALARAAYVGFLGREASDLPQLRAHARRLDGLYVTILRQWQREPDRGQRLGYTALALRTLHARTAAWLNVGAGELGRPHDCADCYRVRAAAAYGTLRALLDPASTNPWMRSARLDGQLRTFMERFRPVVHELFTAYRALPRQRCARGGDLADPGWPRPTGPASAEHLYDRACVRALSEAGHEEALEALLQVAGNDDLRALARRDPFFGPLRTETTNGGEHAARFWRIVGAEQVELVDLPPFGDKRSVLKSLGLVDPAALASATNSYGKRRDLAKSLSVPVAVVDRWWQLAKLGQPRGLRTEPLDAWALRLLGCVGIQTVAELRRRVGSNERQLRDDLRHQAAQLGVRVPTDVELAGMLSL